MMGLHLENIRNKNGVAVHLVLFYRLDNRGRAGVVWAAAREFDWVLHLHDLGGADILASYG